MVDGSSQFEQAMAGGDPAALLGLCDAKASGLPGEEGETWAFLRIHFQQDPRRCTAPSMLAGEAPCQPLLQPASRDVCACPVSVAAAAESVLVVRQWSLAVPEQRGLPGPEHRSFGSSAQESAGAPGL